VSDALSSFSSPEVNELMGSLHFSDEFLHRHGRDKVFFMFYI
jgi:hypothetical protein